MICAATPTSPPAGLGSWPPRPALIPANATGCGVWGGVHCAFDCVADSRVLAAWSPPAPDAFDPGTFLAADRTLYLAGSAGAQLSVAPLIAALVDDLVDTAGAGPSGPARSRRSKPSPSPGSSPTPPVSTPAGRPFPSRPLRGAVTSNS
jgi:hypothetical protein